jgi:peptide/nickel transport system ATP-binding protein
VIADQIMVLHHGRVVERGETVQVLRFPEDAYTTELLAAVPQPSRRFEAS